MKTSDFSGTYDYEKEEANYCATTLLNDFNDGYYTKEQLQGVIDHERAHWMKVLNGTEGGLSDFVAEFNRIITPATGLKM